MASPTSGGAAPGTLPEARNPAPGSAWQKFRATQVLGDSAAGVFSSVPLEFLQKENSEQEKEAAIVEAHARHFGDLVWQAPEGVPPPDFAVITDDLGPSLRAELYVFVQKHNELREVRIKGPRRRSVEEARKDGCELRRAAFRTAQADNGSLQGVQARLRELQLLQWRADDLTGDDVQESAERRLPEFMTATQMEKLKEQQQSVSSLREWIYAKQEEAVENFPPSGPGWSKAGQTMPVPRLPGIWYAHERARETGKPQPWLFFNATTGKYYRVPHGDPGKWTQTGTPNNAVACPVSISHASWCQPTATGRKDDLAVALPELARTGQLLKQPLPFLDSPAALYLLTDGLRGSSMASEFCAKRFHTQLLPRLNERPGNLEDHELLAILDEAIENLDHQLLESSARYSGCNLALVLILGRRVAVGTIGDCRVLLCRPAKDSVGPRTPARQRWQVRVLASGPGGRTAEVAVLEQHRLGAKGPLDLKTANCLHAASASTEAMASQPGPAERILFRVARAAHPFAALGLPLAALQGGIPAVRQALSEFVEVAHPSKVRGELQALAVAAHARIREAAANVERLMGMDPYVTQLLAELYYLMDEEQGIPSPKRAAALLGVEPGCGQAAAQAGIDRRYRAILSQLSGISPEHIEHAFRILEELADAAARPVTPALWTPQCSLSTGLRRAMGFRDLKRPRQLLGTELSSEILHLEEDGDTCFVLLSDGATFSEEQIGEIVGNHPDRPRAVCLKASSLLGSSEAAGLMTVFVNVGAGRAPIVRDARIPDPKRRKVEAPSTSRPPKVRIAHVLLKCPGMADSDIQARRPAPAGRTQVDAERELLQVLEQLQSGDPATLTTRFAAVAKEKSDCKSALTTHADLGWIVPGQVQKELEAVAFELKVGCLSDVVTTPRGVHLVYRLA